MSDHNKKYEFTGNIKEFNGKVLFQIRAVQQFEAIIELDKTYTVLAGQPGGWIESEANLVNNYEEASWVDTDSIVLGTARLSNTFVFGSSIVEDSITTDCLIRDSLILAGSTIYASNIKKSEIYKCVLFNGYIDRSSILLSRIIQGDIKQSKVLRCVINGSTLNKIHQSLVANIIVNDCDIVESQYVYDRTSSDCNLDIVRNVIINKNKIASDRRFIPFGARPTIKGENDMAKE